MLGGLEDYDEGDGQRQEEGGTMLVNGLELMGITVVALCGIIGVAVACGFIHARVKYNRFMKVFNADISKSRFEKLSN
jgi:hypothetical protein